MEITTERIEPGIEQIRVHINHSDYDSDFKKELKKAAEQSNYKGFRKGKVPAGFVLRTQGQSILYNLIFKKINQIIGEHLEKDGVNYLFDPLPSEEQSPYDFDPTKKENFTFLFDLCLPPDLSEVKGWATDNSYRDYQLDVAENEIDERVKDFMRAHGQLVNKELVVSIEEPKISFEVSIPKSEGTEAAEFNIGFLWNELSTEFVSKLEGAKPGDEFTGSIASLISANSQQHIISKYLDDLEVKEDKIDKISENLVDLEIKWSVDEISVFEEAEINEDFLKKVSGSGDLIKDEAEFREKLAEMISSEYVGVSRSIILKHLRERVADNNDLNMPEKFIREFVLAGDKDKALTDDLKKSVMWSVFSTTLAKENGIQVAEEEVKSFLANQVISWMRGVQDQQLIMGMVERLMQDKAAKDNATENIFINKLAGLVYEKVEKEVIKLQKDEFDTLIEEEFPQPDQNEEEE